MLVSVRFVRQVATAVVKLSNYFVADALKLLGRLINTCVNISWTC